MWQDCLNFANEHMTGVNVVNNYLRGIHVLQEGPFLYYTGCLMVT